MCSTTWIFLSFSCGHEVGPYEPSYLTVYPHMICLKYENSVRQTDITEFQHWIGVSARIHMESGVSLVATWDQVLALRFMSPRLWFSTGALTDPKKKKKPTTTVRHLKCRPHCSSVFLLQIKGLCTKYVYIHFILKYVCEYNYLKRRKVRVSRTVCKC